MLKKKNSFSFLIILLAFKGLMAQHVTLPDLINAALEENYRIQIFRNMEQMAENNNTLGNAGFLPSVNVRGDQVWGIQNSEQHYFNGTTRSGQGARNTRFDAAVEVDWTVFDGFRMFAARDRYTQLARLSALDTRYYIEQTIADIAELYYQLITEIRLMESIKKSAAVSAYRLKLEEQKRTIGKGNALLYHQALIDFNADSAQVVNRQMVIRDIHIRINRISNTDPMFTFLPDNSELGLGGLDELPVLLEKALQSNTGLERSLLEEMIAESNIRIEKAARYPQVSVFGNYSYGTQVNEVGFMEKSIASGAQYGVRVRFNLYNGGRQNTRIRNAALMQDNAVYTTQDVRAITHSQLAALLNTYESLINQYRLLEMSLQAAESSLSIAREQLQIGAISGFDFRQAQLTSLRVENQITTILFSLRSIELDIYRLTGELHQKVL